VRGRSGFLCFGRRLTVLRQVQVHVDTSDGSTIIPRTLGREEWSQAASSAGSFSSTDQAGGYQFAGGVEGLVGGAGIAAGRADVDDLVSSVTMTATLRTDPAPPRPASTAPGVRAAPSPLRRRSMPCASCAAALSILSDWQVALQR
jgi:hypothetical protein